MSLKQVHLLCSSGGVRCYSYIGAYKALIKAGYTVSGVSASSMGSVIGLLFCMGLTPEQVEAKIVSQPMKKYLRKRYWLKFFAFFRYPYGMYHHPDYAAFLQDFTGSDPTLKDLPIPFSTIALDLNKRELLSISSDTHPDWKASKLLAVATAVPPMFPPIAIDNMLLVDGGVASESPGWIATVESDGKPVVVLKNSAGLPDDNKKTFPKFLTSMVQSAAAGNDAYSLNQMPANTIVDIHCGNQKAEDLNISSDRIKVLILAGEKAMEQALASCHGDLSKYIKTENIAPVNINAVGLDMARERNIAMIQKFNRKTSGRHQIFISYSHKDQVWFNKLQIMLAPVEAFHGIKVWDDKEIMPGTYWHEAIRSALLQTKVAICLVSQHFINSKYISNNELAYFIEEADKQNVRIFPIAISRLADDKNPLNNIQFVNDPDQPFDELSDEAQHAVLSNMITNLIEIMRQEEG